MKENQALTRPTQNLIPPKRSSLIKMLHQSIMPPKPHPIHHPPLITVILIIRIVLRVLKHVRRIIRKGVWHPHTPTPTSSTTTWLCTRFIQRLLRLSFRLRRRSCRRRSQYRAVRIQSHRYALGERAGVGIVVRVHKLRWVKRERGPYGASRSRRRWRRQ
jgi:hypothetical protein